MAISTYKVFLMHKASSEGTYTKLIDIKEFPDLGGEPEMLVSALAGREHVLAAYKIAVEEKYRFFSFGDAMLIH